MSSHTPADDPKTFEEMNRAGRKGSMLGRMSARFQDAVETGRGEDRVRDVTAESVNDPGVTADDLALKRAKSVKPQRMIVPEGVIIEGALSSGSETEIEGRIDGNVTVDGRLFLGKSALVSGNVRAIACRLDGLVEGQIDCSHELDLGESGRLNADAVAGKIMTLAGQVNGNVTCGGRLVLKQNAQVNGSVRARTLILEEGATFNGDCSIGNTPKPPAKEEKKAEEKAEPANTKE